MKPEYGVIKRFTDITEPTDHGHTLIAHLEGGKQVLISGDELVRMPTNVVAPFSKAQNLAIRYIPYIVPGGNVYAKDIELVETQDKVSVAFDTEAYKPTPVEHVPSVLSNVPVRFGMVQSITETKYSPFPFRVHLSDGINLLVSGPTYEYVVSRMPLPFKISYQISPELYYSECVAFVVKIVTDEEQENSPVGLRYTAGKLRAELVHPDFEQMVAEIMTENPDIRLDRIHPDFLRMVAGIMTENPDIRLDLIPKSMLREVGIVFTEGSKKYPARNWEKGMPWSEVIGPLKRHLLKWLRGLRRDKELSRCHHLAQVIWNVAVLLEFSETHPEQDDRAKIWPGWKPQDPTT